MKRARRTKTVAAKGGSEAKVGRNDPCPCASGKKYKQCCMARDRAAQAERLAWDRATQDMRVALVGFAKEGAFVKDLAIGLGLFWQDRYTADSVHMMSADESLRFFDWFAHDYALQAEDSGRAGQRLIEAYRQEVGDALTEMEAATLDRWIGSLPGSAFVLQDIDAEQGTIVIRDLLIPDRTLTVHDSAAAKHGQAGQILLARPLPERVGLRLAGATVVLPASEEGGLLAYVEGAYQAYLEERPGSARDAETRIDFLRDRAHLFTHYALAWAEREGRPAVSSDDPEARKPGGQALQKLIKWQQERVQVR